jgi:hypothetical protein
MKIVCKERWYQFIRSACGLLLMGTFLAAGAEGAEEERKEEAGTLDIRRPLGRAIPTDAIGHEAAYEEFLKMAIVIEAPFCKKATVFIKDLPNPLSSRIPLPGALGALAIYTGYCKGGEDPLDRMIRGRLFICPDFLAKKDRKTFASHLEPTIGHWISSLGFFWHPSGFLDTYDYCNSVSKTKSGKDKTGLEGHFAQRRSIFNGSLLQPGEVTTVGTLEDLMKYIYFGPPEQIDAEIAHKKRKKAWDLFKPGTWGDRFRPEEPY